MTTTQACAEDHPAGSGHDNGTESCHSAPDTTSASVTTSAPATTTDTSAPADTTTGSAPATTTSGTATTSPTTTDVSTPTSPTSTTGLSPSETTGTAGSTSDAVSPSPTTTVQQAAQSTPLVEPDRLQAPPEDLQAAKAAVPVEENPDPAPQQEIDDIRNTLNVLAKPSLDAPTAAAADAGDAVLTSNVLQWQPDWVQYDEFYRPVIFNPFREPLQVVYLVDGAPRILLIPALASAVTEVATLGAYNFTAMVLNAAGIATNVAVGNFFGGGYLPAPGLPPPPPPPPVVRYPTSPSWSSTQTRRTSRSGSTRSSMSATTQLWVGGRCFSTARRRPGASWVEGPNGERTFEINKTQQFPGVDAPGEGPLPGDYQLLAAESPISGGLSTRDVVLIGGAAVAALLGVGAIVLTVFLGRRRRLH